jgi:hypothetical protein
VGSAREQRNKARRDRAAHRRLRPIRGAAGRRLRSAGPSRGRVVSLGRFAQGLRAPNRRLWARHRIVAWVIGALPVVVLLIWVVARLARHA